MSDIGCIVGVIEVSMAKEDIFRIQINEVRNNKRRAARLHL